MYGGGGGANKQRRRRRKTEQKEKYEKTSINAAVVNSSVASKDATMTLECIQSREGGDRGSQRGAGGGGAVDHMSD